MKSYEVWTARRKASRLTRQQVADRANVSVNSVIAFENGEFVQRDIVEAIKNAIWMFQREESKIEHYRSRILELGILLKDEDNKEMAMQNISHMMIELGRLQGELMGFDSNYKREL